MENRPDYLAQKQLKPLMPENMRNELMAALRSQNVQHNRSRSIRDLKKFNFSSPTIPGSPAATNNEEDKRSQLRLQAIQEIRTSELSYLKQLDLLINYFVVPLKGNGMILEREHGQIFGQLETIYNLSQELLKKLDDDLDNVVRAFMNLGPFFKLYSVYAFDYRNSLCTLQTLMQKNAAMKKFVTNAESRPEVQTKLISLLITPIQRIPRYKLLLQQVLLYTSPSDRSYKQLQESIQLVEQSVSHINSVVEDFENTQRLITIQNSFTNKSLRIVKPARKILKEGVLRKLKTDGSTSKKYCILMSDLFIYCRMLKDQNHLFTENGLDCCCIFPLKKCKVLEMFSGNFKISCSGDGTIFSSDNPDESRSWYQAIRDAIELHVQCRKTLRKLSSNRKPMRKKHIQRLDPEDDYLWLLRRKTASPQKSPKAHRSGHQWLNCLRANRSFQDESIVSPLSVTSPVRRTSESSSSSSLLNRRAVEAASPQLSEPYQRLDVASGSGVAAPTGGQRKVHFQLPASYYKRY